MEAMYETEMEFSPVFIGLGKICEKQKKYEEAEESDVEIFEEIEGNKTGLLRINSQFI